MSIQVSGSRRIVFCMVIGLAMMFQTGCATIISGTTQKIPVTSEPGGAMVTTGNITSTTPTELLLSRKENHVVLISMEGHHSERVTVEKHLNAALAGNILFGGVIGVGVDAASGASNELKPKKIHVVLESVKPGETLEVRDWVSPKDEEKAQKEEAKKQEEDESSGTDTDADADTGTDAGTDANTGAE